MLLDQCTDLELEVSLVSTDSAEIRLHGPQHEPINVSLRHARHSMLEQLFSQLRFDFDQLPLLTRGDSKEVRLLTPRVAVVRLLPTVYSFTTNRYGRAPGTAALRARFSAQIFRAMDCNPGPWHLSSAFLGLQETDAEPLLFERHVETCNLEVRVKRYHIGSPVHRYRYTDLHRTAHGGPPLMRWTRFPTPVVCFDWRHPLTDDAGERLADEPISDDYASVWLDDMPRAKRLALDTFLWLEARFGERGVSLIDICLFVDRTGSVVFGEISPDCMRVRREANDDATAMDKDNWRAGGSGAEVLERYQELSGLLFADARN